MEMGKEEREERERLAKVIEEGAKLRKEMIEGKILAYLGNIPLAFSLPLNMNFKTSNYKRL